MTKKLNDEKELSRIEISRNVDGMYILFNERQYHLAINWGIGVNNESGFEKRDGNGYVFNFRIVLHESAQDDQNRFDYPVNVNVADYRGRDSFVPQLLDGVQRCFSRTSFPYTKFQKHIIKRLEGFFEALDMRLRDMKHNYACITQVFEQPVYMPKSIYGNPDSNINYEIVLVDESKPKETK